MKGIAKKLAAVMADIEHPDRSEYVKYGDFYYATRDDIFECTRRALIKHGVAWVPKMRRTGVEPTGKETKKGDKIFRVGVDVEITFIDTDTGETFETSWSGESYASDDRGSQAAATQAVRFALTNTFMLLDGFDIEKDTAVAPAEVEENTHREAAPPEDPTGAIIDRLYEVGLDDDQVWWFGEWLMGMEGVELIEEIPEAKMLAYWQRLESLSDKELADKAIGYIEDAMAEAEAEEAA